MSNMTSIIPGTPNYDPALDPQNSYGYVPSKSLGIAFVVLFALSTATHLGQVFLSRRAWLLTLVAGGLGETLGWGGRLWSSFSPDSYPAYMIQIVCLIITPAFLSAAVYAILGWLIVHVDPSLSPIRPRLYWRIFVTADIISLVIQSAGGGIAASANNDRSMAKMGSNIMLAGIVFQFATTVLFSFFFLQFIWRMRTNGVTPNASAQYLLSANLFATAMVIVRGLYRVVELAEGWNGYLLQHELWFLWDAIPMILLLVALNAAHPCWSLPVPKTWSASSYETEKEPRESKIHLTA